LHLPNQALPWATATSLAGSLLAQGLVDTFKGEGLVPDAVTASTMRVKGGHRMATAIDIRELSTRLDEAIALASAGGEVILLEGSTPRARLVPFGPVPPRVAGLHPGALQPAPDFDAPLSDDFWAGQ